MEETRIEWIDICRGLLITLVVIGHSTGLFNEYIYQFHMAGFFFLSGYLSKPNKRNFFNDVFIKINTVLLPVISSTIFAITIFSLLSLFKQNTILNLSIFIDWCKQIIDFFTKGWGPSILGANWFLCTLFGVSVLTKVQSNLYYSFRIIYVIQSVIIYFIGYQFVKIGVRPHIGMIYLDLVFIGQMFYNIGFLTKKINIFNIIQKSRLKIIISLIISVLVLYIGKKLHLAVDWSARTFKNPLIDGWCALNGIWITVIISFFIQEFPLIKKVLEYMGKNTIGIVLLHFSCFKPLFILFYFMGIISKDDITYLVPGRMNTNVLEIHYWFIISVCSIALSLIIWNIILKSKVIRFLLGKDLESYTKIWIRVSTIKIYKYILKVLAEVKNRLIQRMLLLCRLFRNNIIFCLFILLVIILASIPWYKQSIMCNDELQARLWSIKGFSQFYEHYIEDHIRKGRALSANIVSLSMFLGFLGRNNWSFKIVQILSIWLNIVLFIIFIKKIYGNRFAISCGLFIIVFLPVTFEHTAPNAFNTLYNFPFSFLFISLILFIMYLETNQKYKLVCSMFFLFLNLISYESFVLFLPIYFAVLISKGYKNKQLLMKGAYPTITAFVFGICYILSRLIFKSDYVGNQVANISISKSLKIIKQLALASFPGYWLFSQKYRQLLQDYYNLELLNYIRIFLISITFGTIIFQLTMLKKEKTGCSKKLFSLSMGILCIILPNILISIAQLYQNNIGDEGYMFKALPTTYFCFFAAVFCMCFTFWWILEKIPIKLVRVCIICMLSLYLIPIQIMNDVFSEQQNKDFEKIELIESLFSTELLGKMDGMTLFGADLFKQHNTLAIHNSYWNDYANTKGISVNILNKEGGETDFQILLDNNEFTIWNNKEVCLISTQKYTGGGLVKRTNNEFINVNFEFANEDNGFYEYFYSLKETGELVASDCSNFFKNVGNKKIDDCLVLEGYYDDGWIGRNATFLLKTKEEGKIDIQLYCPLEDFNDCEIAVYLNETLSDVVQIREVSQMISVVAEPNREIKLQLRCNFVQTNTSDPRELTTIISFIRGR